PAPAPAAPPLPDANATAGDVGRSYFAAAAARDPAAMAAHWHEDGVDDFTISGPLRGPGEVRGFFEDVFTAIPDFDMRVERMIEEDDRAAVAWRGTGHLSGGPFQGIAPTGAFVEQRGLDVLEVENGLIRTNTAYADGLTMARQFGLLPAAGSAADRAMTKAFNLKTRLGR
ncbi:MAG: ester cyclase, partial [Thermoleophilaceae bacterium]|nr:ester cyclase [Thermoleophilaceae bacterium]